MIRAPLRRAERELAELKKAPQCQSATGPASLSVKRV